MTDPMSVEAHKGLYQVRKGGALTDASWVFSIQLTSEELHALEKAVDQALAGPVRRYEQARATAAEALWAEWLAAGAIQPGPNVLLRFLATDQMWRALERGHLRPVDGGHGVFFPAPVKCLSSSMWGQRYFTPVVHLYDRPTQSLCMGAGRAASPILAEDDPRDVCGQCRAVMQRQAGKSKL